MQKMECGAARMAGRNANVDDMEEWRRTRGSRASSARNPQETREFRAAGKPTDCDREQEPEWDPQNPPFWEQDNPFSARGKEQQPREQPHWDAGQYRRESRQRRPGDDSGRRQEFVQRENGDWQPMGREIRRQDGEDPQPSRPETGRPGRQVDLREYRDARSRSSRGETRQDGRQDERGQRRDDAWQNQTGPHKGSRHNMLLLVMALLGLAAIAVIIGLKVFEIRGVDVKGNDSVSAQNIIALSGISVGENILKVDLGVAKKNIESDPLLEVKSISRIYPDRISIEVRQRKPHGAIAYLGSYVIIDENGFVLDVRDSLPAGQYPLVTGVEIKPSEKGKTLMGVDGEQQKTMYGLLKALYDNNAMQYVSEANLGNGGDIRLLTSEGLQIDLGKPADFDKKAQWIACTVPELRNHGYTSGVLHITGTGSPVYSKTGDNQASQQASSVSDTGDAGGEEEETEPADEGAANENTDPKNAT